MERLREQQQSAKMTEELMKEVDLLLYRTTPIRESNEKALVELEMAIKLGFGSIYGYGNIISTLKYDKLKADWVITDVEYKWGK